MSTYVREKVLRVPTSEIFKSCDWTAEEDYQEDRSWFLEQKFYNLFKYAEIGYFQTAPTEEDFIDFVLDYEYDCSGEYGKIRNLYELERERFLPVFQQINPNFTIVDMEKVRLVEFCWYNGTEAEGYYEPNEDPFFEEIMLPKV
jgi:hypothetical protein